MTIFKRGGLKMEIIGFVLLLILCIFLIISGIMYLLMPFEIKKIREILEKILIILENGKD